MIRAAASGAAPDEVEELVREAYLVAVADGDIEARERDVVDRFLGAAGVGSERYEAIHAWGRTAVEHSRLGRSLFVPSG